jgi:hypothetical protein
VVPFFDGCEHKYCRVSPNLGWPRSVSAPLGFSITSKRAPSRLRPTANCEFLYHLSPPATDGTGEWVIMPSVNRNTTTECRFNRAPQIGV